MHWHAWNILLGALCAIGLPQARSSGHDEVVYEANEATDYGSGPVEPSRQRKLHGRFLHITDFHPDPFYKPHTSTTKGSASCHRRHGPAGYYGAAKSDCDSPYTLINETFAWINENLRDSIDFVVWTGDSARHDNDEKIPRNESQIVEQNEFVVSKFVEVFAKGKRGNDDDNPTYDLTIPIVPTIGNNDMMPHNIFDVGPNRWTARFLDIWRHFIPEEQRHQFHRGGWYYTEVLPGRLAVISLNTMYFFDSNSAVDGCASKSEPGYEQMDWLRIQLQFLRDRGMKAILIGHVPPARTSRKKSWDETCWQKYTLWKRQYRDVIVTGMYGHMNLDHFMLEDFKDLRKDVKRGQMKERAVKGKSMERQTLDSEIGIAAAASYLLDLRDLWSKLPSPGKMLVLSNQEHKRKSEDEGALPDYMREAQFEDPYLGSLWRSFITALRTGDPGNFGWRQQRLEEESGDDEELFMNQIGGPYAERFSISLVGPSVIPTYFPTLRVIEYNVSGLDANEIFSNPASYMTPRDDDSLEEITNKSEERPASAEDISPETLDSTESAYDPREWLQKKKARHGKGHGSKTTKKKKKHKFTVPAPPDKSAPPGPAYSPQTFSLVGYTQYFANLTRWNELAEAKAQGKGKGKGEGESGLGFEVEYDTKEDHVWKLKDLTTKSLLELASRIGEVVEDGKELRLDEDDGADSVGVDAEVAEEKNDEEEEEGGDVDAAKKKHKKKKKKGGKGKKRRAKNRKDWYTFVDRAFVKTKEPKEIKEEFGGEQVVVDHEGRTTWENMDL